MISLRMSATGAALAVLLLIACRDAPTVPVVPPDSVSAPLLAVDSLTELPGPARILEAWTDVSFYDGRPGAGGVPLMVIGTGMRYYGNRATMSTDYYIRGEIEEERNISNSKDSFYNPFLEKNWTEAYYIPTGEIRCGLDMGAGTQHAAWWFFWVRWAPNSESTKDHKFTRGEHKLPECDHQPHPDNSGSGSSGGWVTIETCHYWAHYVNGVLVDIELRYCTYDMIPVAEE